MRDESLDAARRSQAKHGDALSWAEIRRLALRHKKALWLANGVAVLATLCSVPIPLLLPLLVDEVLLGRGDAALKVMNHLLPDGLQKAAGYIGLMLLLTLVLRVGALVFNVLQARLFAGLAKDIVYRIRLRLIERLKRISLREYESLGSGTVTTHLVTDLDTLDKFVGETLSRLLVATLTLAGTAGILMWMHWKLALLIMLFNPLVILLTVKLGKRVKHLKKLENDSTSRFTQALSETLDAIQEVRAGNRQGFFLGRLGMRAQEVRDYAINSQWKSDASGRASGLLFQFGIDIFRAAAMLTVLFSDLSIGQMLAVFSYLWFMMTPVEQLLNLQYAYYAAGGALTRINELLARADEPQYVGGTDPFAGRETVGVEVRGLSFGYGEDLVLDQLNLSIAPGEKVAIVGASGGGKSTLVQLLLGLYTARTGVIRFGGVSQQDIGLDTVRANLTMGRDCSDEACWRALEVAQLDSAIRDLPQGLDSVVGRSGVRMSGGQRQRMAIARMVLSDPKVVILDEATSALDAATEYNLHQALARFLRSRTTLIIAHRLSAVKQADRVLVFDGGRIVEDGGHQQLIADGGLYAKLYGHLQQI
ncbi:MULTISPECIES: ABC transporter ATP-binding protein [Pseudomonas syringae group]|uniref:ABC transporter ATP-binding protein n=2 Tax=Pseudomonas syringae group TaxID=136849 RepID=A0A2K4WRU7_PSESX|nr:MULTISPECIES: ABC transporter ATP-binding protein [Pseudomonas syringae group]MBI6730437.1 ABC transporter ATP-binding protein [Pseudomonas amygdali]AVB15902.1 ABC transporter ATP-binding protein [Pseudomonas amygdali pv. morsprunorum]KWS61023.1 ABC transporter ATP-binding protein [Pseudomonas amygdali pv. morsprunorum]KWS63214.1 ABC transporter ATP-binding protein [Pseudomonas amygdali pv. morsprunorum]MBI6812216.1 ABC transporter ATP-binding protein [Pseudomonas amygdali]